MSKDIGIIFFSKDGSTRVLANELATKYDATTIELKEKASKTNMISNTLKATQKKASQLEGNPQNEIKDLNKIYLCTPIWASNGTPAMNAFIENSDFSGKSVVIVTVKGFSPPSMLKKAHNYLSEKVEDKSGTVSNCYTVHGAPIGKTAKETDIQNQINILGL